MVRNHHCEEIDVLISSIAGCVHIGHHRLHTCIHLRREALGLAGTQQLGGALRNGQTETIRHWLRACMLKQGFDPLIHA